MVPIFATILRRAASLLIVVELLTCQSRVLSTTTALADWELTSPKDIRFGMLTVIHGPSSDRLIVSVLRPEANAPRRVTAPFVPPEHKQPTEPGDGKPVSRATWVWNTDSLLISTEEENVALSTVTEGHFDKIFLQLPRNFVEDTSHDARLRTLVARLHRCGAVAYALSGSPEFCLPKNHSLVERLIRRVIDYNNGSGDDARFIGFHADIEPYLLPGFGGPRRNWILEQYLTVTELAARIVHSQGLLLGIDIPFWYDLPDEFTGQVDSVEFNGTKKTVNESVFDWADEICVMSYRTIAEGANGIVSLLRSGLDHAEKHSKAVRIGLETADIPDEDNVTFSGIPATDTTMLGTSERVVAMSVAGDSMTVSLVARPEACAIFKTQGDNRDSSKSIFLWEVNSSSHISSTSLSFAKLGRKQLNTTIDTVIQQLSGFRSFGGIAIHHAASYARLPE